MGTQTPEAQKDLGRKLNAILETEIWIAGAPDQLIHYNGERFLGP